MFVVAKLKINLLLEQNHIDGGRCRKSKKKKKQKIVAIDSKSESQGNFARKQTKPYSYRKNQMIYAINAEQLRPTS